MEILLTTRNHVSNSGGYIESLSSLVRSLVENLILSQFFYLWRGSSQKGKRVTNARGLGTTFQSFAKPMAAGYLCFLGKKASENYAAIKKSFITLHSDLPFHLYHTTSNGMVWNAQQWWLWLVEVRIVGIDFGNGSKGHWLHRLSQELVKES